MQLIWSQNSDDCGLERLVLWVATASRWEWSVHAALLNNDVRIVVDETQLQGIGYKTSILLQKFG